MNNFQKIYKTCKNQSKFYKSSKLKQTKNLSLWKNCKKAFILEKYYLYFKGKLANSYTTYLKIILKNTVK